MKRSLLTGILIAFSFFFMRASDVIDLEDYVIVESSGTSLANTVYKIDNTIAGQRRFESSYICNSASATAQSLSISKNPSTMSWELKDASGVVLYTHSADTPLPPDIGWTTTSSGTYPAPTMSGYVSRLMGSTLPATRFEDPCSCSDPLNFEFGGTYYFHDVLSVINPAADSVRLDSTNTQFFFDSTALGGVLFMDSTTFTQVNDSTYTLEFWRASGVEPIVDVIVYFGALAVPTSVDGAYFRPVCFIADCAENTIPTLSEWSLIILGLMVITVGVISLRRDPIINRQRE